jgi:hypothetical protein
MGERSRGERAILKKDVDMALYMQVFTFEGKIPTRVGFA